MTVAITASILLLFTGQTVLSLPSTRIKFTIWTTPLPWNDAVSFCSSEGEQLVSLTSAAKVEAIAFLWASVSSEVTRYWTGLHSTDPSYQTYAWPDCDSLGDYSLWANVSHTDQHYCIAADTDKDNHWVHGNCGHSLPFVCEKGQGENCTFEMFSEKTVREAKQTVTKEMKTSAECEKSCLEFYSEGMECWIYTLYREKCVLYYDDMFGNLQNKSNWAEKKNMMLGRKVCFSGEVKDKLIFQQASAVSATPKSRCWRKETPMASPPVFRTTLHYSSLTQQSSHEKNALGSEQSTDGLSSPAHQTIELVSPRLTDTHRKRETTLTNLSPNETLTSLLYDATTLMTNQVAFVTNPRESSSTADLKTMNDYMTQQDTTRGFTAPDGETVADVTSDVSRTWETVSDVTSDVSRTLETVSDVTSRVSRTWETVSDVTSDVSRTWKAVSDVTSDVSRTSESAGMSQITRDITTADQNTPDVTAFDQTSQDVTAFSQSTPGIPTEYTITEDTSASRVQQTHESATVRAGVEEGSSTTQYLCPCECVSETSAKQTEDTMKQILDLMTVPKEQFSSVRRKLTCAPDSRTSATACGVLGITLLASVFGILILCDINRLCIKTSQLS